MSRFNESLVGTEEETNGASTSLLSGDTVTFGDVKERTETDIQVDPSIVAPVSDDVQRSAINVAFVPAGDAAARERLNQSSSRTLLNQEGAQLRPLNGKALEIEQYLRTKLQILLPVYNQEADIGRTLSYLTNQLGIPPENIVASSGSTDRSDQIIEGFGVEVLDQYKTLEKYVDMPKFLELTKADNLKQLRGKGLTMLAGHIHQVMSGRTSENKFMLQTDTDIKNIGTGENQWDPVTYFAHYLQENPGIDAIKASKNGRNNQPMHIFFNILPTVDARVGQHYQSVARDRWVLTGEYGWRSDHTSRLRWSTGYAIETVLAMSQTDLDLDRRQVEMPQPRTDGANLMTKETVMYTDIQRTATEIVRTGKTLHELSVSEIAGINERRREQMNDIIWLCHEKDANPGPDAMPNEATQIQPGRLIPDIDTLIREKVIYSGN